MKVLPNQIDSILIKKEMKNRIILALFEILMFLIPYVIPIPRESILADIAKINEFINISKTS